MTLAIQVISQVGLINVISNSNLQVQLRRRRDDDSDEPQRDTLPERSASRPSR